jgi:hypothetical protein
MRAWYWFRRSTSGMRRENAEPDKGDSLSLRAAWQTGRSTPCGCQQEGHEGEPRHCSHSMITPLHDEPVVGQTLVHVETRGFASRLQATNPHAAGRLSSATTLASRIHVGARSLSRGRPKRPVPRPSAKVSPGGSPSLARNCERATSLAAEVATLRRGIRRLAGGV